MHEEIAIKQNELKGLQDKVLCFKCVNELIEGEIVNKREEISSLKEKSKCKMLEEKMPRLESALKNKTEILLIALKEKR